MIHLLVLCTQILYKENLSKGTPLPVTPEMERVKLNQENFSSVFGRKLFNSLLKNNNFYKTEHLTVHPFIIINLTKSFFVNHINWILLFSRSPTHHLILTFYTFYNSPLKLFLSFSFHLYVIVGTVEVNWFLEKKNQTVKLLLTWNSFYLMFLG